MSSMSGYIAPLRDMNFLIEELIGIHSLNTIPEFKEITHEDTRAVLQEGGRFAESVLDPINQKGDRDVVFCREPSRRCTRTARLAGSIVTLI